MITGIKPKVKSSLSARSFVSNLAIGKNVSVLNDVFSVFALSTWTDLGVTTVPQNFVGNSQVQEYIRVSVVTSGKPINGNSVSGVIIIDIFTSAGTGPVRAAQIADSLDNFLPGKTYKTGLGETQFFLTSAFNIRKDLAMKSGDNAALCAASYEIPFNYSFTY